MNKLIFLLTFSCMLLGLSSCSEGDHSQHGDSLRNWMTPNGKVKTLSTIAMVNDLVKKVGEDHVDAEVLIKGELDPHSYQLVKGDDEKLAFADIIFSNGLGLEHGPSLQNYLAKTPKSISLGNLLMKDDDELILNHQGQLDPHIWMDIGMWARTVPYIVDSLSAKDPSHAQEYHDNGVKLVKEMLKEHQKLKDELNKLPASKRYLVTSHDAFHYFARAYLAETNESDADWQARCAAPEGLAPESQISTSDIQSIIFHLKKYDIHTIFPESNTNRDSIRKIVQAAKEKGINVKIADVALYADAMGKLGSDADTYLKMMHHNGLSIASHLKDDVKE